MGRLCYFIFGVLACIAACSAQELFFPSTREAQANDKCTVQDTGESGTCQLYKNCQQFQQIFDRVGDFKRISCGHSSNDLVCCPDSPVSVRPTADPSKAAPVKAVPSFPPPQGIVASPSLPQDTYDTSTPDTDWHSCGTERTFPPLLEYYRDNATKTRLEREGFVISNVRTFYDAVVGFDADNGTHSTDLYTVNLDLFPFSAVGGEDARVHLATYMAIIGERKGADIDWFCDGVLINWEWILTAAHCFKRIPNVVRLGEYNLNTTVPTDEEDPKDYGIKKIILYPDYEFPSTSHDLALIQLEGRAYIARPDMNPVCLPWDERRVPLKPGDSVTLTGWGATSFGATHSDVLQEVNITVFDTDICDRSYSTLVDYQRKFPSGINSESHLCAGDEKGGKDACQGDSGGPIVYKHKHSYVLAGIVSAGHGCGLKEFPGIYVPIDRPQYLHWIKKVAFGPSYKI